MIEVASPEFLILCVLAVVLYHLYNAPRYHAWVMGLANGAFILTYAHWPMQKLFLGWLLGSGYLMVALVQRKKIRHPLAIGLYIVALVGLLLVVRAVQYGGAFPPPVLLVGYSFLMFKLIHMLVDATQGRLENLSPLTFFNYLCGFYTWVAGPIQRYQDFSAQAREDRAPPSFEDVVKALDRIVNGCIKAFIMAPWVANATAIQILFDNPVPVKFWTHLVLWTYGFYLFLFLDFSGYTDIVIGVAALLGMRLPENFSFPFAARNLIDFWARWHMTLSHWLRDYLFHPIYYRLTRFSDRLRWANAAVAYLLTFTLAGLWHGPKSGYLIFALMHGCAAFFNQCANDLLFKALPAPWRSWYRKSRLVRGAAVAFTLTYVAISLLFFGTPLEDLQRVERIIVWRLTPH